MTGVSIIAHRPSPAPKGFTLMEMLVVLGIFATVVVTASDIFLLANRSQRKIFALERAQADARFTMEAMAREARTGRINYGYYAARGTPIAVPDAELALIDSAGTTIRFFRSDVAADCGNDPSSTPCLLVAVGGNAPQPITPRGVTVGNARFYIAPLTDPTVFDPATGTYASDEQPHVTIVLSLQSGGSRSGEASTVSLQTTVENRSYRR